MSVTSPRVKYILRIAAANAAATLFVAVAFFNVGPRTAWADIGYALGIAAVFSMCIGTLCATLIPRITPLFWHFGLPFNWILLVVLIYGLAIAGAALAVAVLVASGYVPGRQFGGWFSQAARYAIITTLTFGIAVSAYEMMRTRLDQALIAVRTKERDEAEARRIAAEARLASLESRVHPHFLFNTLNSIASLIPTDPAGAEQMTTRLASLLRASLDGAHTPLVRLDEEIATVREYLEIERVRFGDRLRWSVDVDARAAATLIPRFALQTLVENGVKYAVSPRREGGHIAIDARVAGSRARIFVHDDGPGLDSSAVPADHGLDLVRQRLALTFGDRAALTIDSRPGRTAIAIEVPFEQDAARLHR
jgi:sensor histidine kinase YesM